MTDITTQPNYLSSLLDVLRNRDKNSIGWRLLIYVVFVSSLFACLQTGFQIYLDYNTGVDHIENQFSQIDNSYHKSLARSIWEIDKGQVESIISGISSLPSVESVTVHEFIGSSSAVNCEGGEFKVLASLSPLQSSNNISQTFPIFTENSSAKQCLGRLDVTISLDPLYEDLAGKFIFILILQTIKTFSVSIFILAIFHYLVTRHLVVMVDYTKAIGNNEAQGPLLLDFDEKNQNNELTKLADTLNDARQNVQTVIDYQRRKAELEHELEAQKEKEKLKEFHNRQIEKKNNELANANLELQDTIDMLGAAQNKLIRSERMAALGGMVRGVAHELNTPIGVAATGASLLQTKNTDLSEQYYKGSMTQKGLESNLKITGDTAELVGTALKKAANLINAFKLVSVEDHDDKLIEFDLSAHLIAVVASFNEELRTSLISIDMNQPKQLIVSSFPAAFYLIITNLVRNSLTHAFKAEEKGRVLIETTVNGADLILVYKDNGSGMSANTLSKIFDPFYSTSNESENSGLGMNVVYNLVQDKINGHLDVESTVGEGSTFTFQIRGVIKSVEL